MVKLKQLFREYAAAFAWALLLHSLVLVLLLHTTLQKPVALPQAEPISTFLYQPAIKSPEPVAEMKVERPVKEPLAHADKIAAKQAAASHINHSIKPLEVSATIVSKARQDEPVLASSDIISLPITPRSSLAERSLKQLAQPNQQALAQAADASYQQWQQQQLQPRITVAKQHQHAGANPEKAVLFTYNDGQQLVKLGDNCLIVDPQLSGFEQMMQAKGAPCQESDDALLFRQTMAKWLSR
ncbi:hypothetical protein [Rheinheimera sp. UJ63]|uniref:hypothetical protein n=1 Tax=Rheinheimera sp. UJ63 TaxID=2910157 RepID=UPI001F2415B6|nr:hypothetical protein [Rheinheimera sp. UJ63]MCF4010908.1 hypothetical protein [Rheinheimera sp. UJ63]